ncbi:glycerophosphodiester phosphodiesterase [Paenibacillaceae bacterium]|nr:glycerophosphodiester phosphodiesterase [Paenibacillaceae bacterium]
MVKIVAHRGWSGKAPENTISAFKLAMTDPDIPYIELDIHLSKDGVPVVIHDHTLERTTNGRGLVKDYTLEQLRQMDAGSWFAPEFAGEQIPTLNEVLELIKGRCMLHAELKVMGDEYEGIEAAVIASIMRLGMQDEVILSSFDHDSMKRAHELNPSIKTVLILLGKSTLIMEQLRHTGATGLSIHYAFVTRPLVEEMTAHGIDLGLWTIDEPDTLAAIIAQYPDIRITTNYPDRILSIIRDKVSI